MQIYTWSDQENAQLAELRQKGLKPSKIALIMGKTKNAVCGRINRIRLKEEDHKPVYRRGPKRHYKNCIGSRNCSVCNKKFRISSVLQRFCDSCKNSNYVRFG